MLKCGDKKMTKHKKICRCGKQGRHNCKYYLPNYNEPAGEKNLARKERRERRR